MANSGEAFAFVFCPYSSVLSLLAVDVVLSALLDLEVFGPDSPGAAADAVGVGSGSECCCKSLSRISPS